MPCHPYEPGFAPCVGYDVPPPRYPYGPDLPTSRAVSDPTFPAPQSLVPTAPTRLGLDDELGPPSQAVPEPAPLLLTALALTALWRLRRLAR